MIKLILSIAIIVLLAACSLSSSDIKAPSLLLPDHRPLPDIELDIANLRPCSDSQDHTFTLNSHHPITVFVHGSNSSPSDFFILAQLYQLYGQQVVCFSYPYRDSLVVTAAKLVFSLQQLTTVTHSKKITVLGHSLGGLVARKSLENEGLEYLSDSDIKLNLITVATPFSGVDAAHICTSNTLNWLSLGGIYGICRGVIGECWYELTSESDFIKYPKPLLPSVQRYLKVVTNEKNRCRHKNMQGTCVESDYVFGLSEQYNSVIDNYPQVTNIQVDAGHVEIIGYKLFIPIKLLEILQQEKMLSAQPFQG